MTSRPCERLTVEEWVARELAKSPSITEGQAAMLRRVKRDLIRSAARS
jgi:hypothetical protein